MVVILSCGPGFDRMHMHILLREWNGYAVFIKGQLDPFHHRETDVPIQVSGYAIGPTLLAGSVRS